MVWRKGISEPKGVSVPIARQDFIKHKNDRRLSLECLKSSRLFYLRNYEFLQNASIDEEIITESNF